MVIEQDLWITKDDDGVVAVFDVTPDARLAWYPARTDDYDCGFFVAIRDGQEDYGNPMFEPIVNIPPAYVLFPDLDNCTYKKVRVRVNMHIEVLEEGTNEKT